MYSFTNHFSKSELKGRIQMMNRRRSGWRALWRYGSLLGVFSSLLVVWQCTFNDTNSALPIDMQSFVAQKGKIVYWIVTPNMTDKTINKLSQVLQGQHIVFKPTVIRSQDRQLIRLEVNLFKYKGSTYPESILHEEAFTETVLKKNNIVNHQFVSAGNSSKPSLLPSLGFWYDPETGFHSDLVTNDFPKSLQRQADKESGPTIFLNNITKEDLSRLREFEERERPGVTRMRLKNFTMQPTKALPPQYRNKTFGELLEKASQDTIHRSQSYSMDMNRLLEVSFMKYRQYMLYVTDDYHLDLLPEYKQATIKINGKSATLSQLRDIHIRQLARAYVHKKEEFERVFGSEPYDNQYAINITLAPKRAQRDSSYYVFSPFYSGDF